MSHEEVANIKKKWGYRLKKARGFLSRKQRNRLVATTHAGTSNSDFFYRIVPAARGSVLDLIMIAERVDDEALEDIFLTSEQNNGSPLAQLLRTLLPRMPDLNEEESWRMKLMAELVHEGLFWYLKSGFFTTSAHQKVLYEALDILSDFQHKRKVYKASYDEFGNLIVDRVTERQFAIKDNNDEDSDDSKRRRVTK